MKNAGRPFERPAASGTQLEYCHPLDRRIMRSPVTIDSRHAGVLDPHLFVQKTDFLVLGRVLKSPCSQISQVRWASEPVENQDTDLNRRLRRAIVRISN